MNNNLLAYSTLDLVPFIAKAMANHPLIRRELDKISGESWLTAKYRNDTQKRHCAVYYELCDPVTEEYCHQASFLLLTALAKDERREKALAEIEKIIKTNWEYVYRYVKNSGEKLEFDGFGNKFMSTGKVVTKNDVQYANNYFIFNSRVSKKALPASPAEEPPPDATVTNYIKDVLEGEFAVFLYLLNLTGKRLLEETDLFQMIMKIHMETQQWMNDNSAKSAIALSDRQKEMAQELWKWLETEMGNRIPASLDDMKYCPRKEEMKYWIMAKSAAGLPIDNILKHEFTLQELRYGFADMISKFPDTTQITETVKQEVLDFFLYTLAIRSTALEYAALRRQFVLADKKLKKTELKFKQAVRSKKQERKEAYKPKKKTEAEAMLKSRLTSAEATISKLEEEKDKLKTLAQEAERKLEKAEHAKQRELAELEDKFYVAQAAYHRMLASAAEEETAPAAEDGVNEAILSKIIALRVVIIGGRMDWQQRLKVKFPNFRFIASTEVRYDLAVLDKADVIVLCWKNMGHDILDRTLFYIGRKNEKIAYLANTNERLFLRLLVKHVIRGRCSVYRECLLPAVEETHME